MYILSAQYSQVYTRLDSVMVDLAYTWKDKRTHTHTHTPRHIKNTANVCTQTHTKSETNYTIYKDVTQFKIYIGQFYGFH